VIEDGKWTALLGVNNAGKSALLRFFYEFRPFFAHVEDISRWQSLVYGNEPSVGFTGSVRDRREVFHNQNDRSLWLELSVYDTELDPARPTLGPVSAMFEFPRVNPGTVKLSRLLYDGSVEVPLGRNPGVSGSTLQLGGREVNLRLAMDAA